ncbi:MAG: hypothetical protein OHK0011_00250 [Turneriella sp.]
MRYRILLPLLLVIQACRPEVERIYEQSFALRAARDLDSAGNTALARYYIERARREPSARAEAEAFLRRIEERVLRTPDCVESKRTELAINQYPRIRHKHLFQMGVCLEEAGDTRRALQFYALSEKAGSAQPQLYIRRALLYSRTGNKAAATADFERAVALNREYPPALLNLALHRLVTGERAAAEGLLAQLRKLRPGYADVVADALKHDSEVLAFFREKIIAAQVQRIQKESDHARQ